MKKTDDFKEIILLQLYVWETFLILSTIKSYEYTWITHIHLKASIELYCQY